MTESDRCCHAVQDKVWVDAPDVPLGAWEFYTVLADDKGDDAADVQSACCSTAPSQDGPCCAGPTPEPVVSTPAAQAATSVEATIASRSAWPGCGTSSLLGTLRSRSIARSM